MTAPVPHCTVRSTAIGPSRTSINAHLDDMRSMATMLQTLAEECLAHGDDVVALGWNLPLAASVLSPGTALTCAGKVTGLTLGRHGLPWLGARCRGYAWGLTLSVGLYETAESAAEAAINRVRTPGDLAVVAFVLWQGIQGTETSPGASLEWQTVLARSPGLIPAVITAVEDVVPGRYSGATTLMAAAVERVEAYGGPVRVTMTSGPNSGAPAPTVRSHSEAAERIVQLYEAPEAAAHIQIQRVVDPTSGAGSWTVILPGTSSWGFNAANPLDAGGNVMAASGRQSAAESAVVLALTQAMKKEGVLSKREPVMVTGHSQGGMVAANLARHNAGGKGPFNITHVTTYGSPVGTHRVPLGVHQLNVEQDGDIVPQLDGARSGIRQPRTVHLQLHNPGALAGPDGRPDPIAAHDMGRYARDFREAAARAPAGSPLSAYERDTRHFYEGDARTYQFDLSRGPRHGSP